MEHNCFKKSPHLVPLLIIVIKKNMLYGNQKFPSIEKQKMAFYFLAVEYVYRSNKLTKQYTVTQTRVAIAPKNCSEKKIKKNILTFFLRLIASLGFSPCKTMKINA